LRNLNKCEILAACWLIVEDVYLSLVFMFTQLAFSLAFTSKPFISW